MFLNPSPTHSLEKIKDINEFLYQYLMQRYYEDGLLFVPRKINRSKKLEQGYWFLGAEYNDIKNSYIHLSFWEGYDTLRKIHNIGFVIWADGSAAIELSARNENRKWNFLNRIKDALTGNYDTKEGINNRWYRYYPGHDYMKSFSHFINIEKPKVDRIIESEGGNYGITKVKIENFDKYIHNIEFYRGKEDIVYKGELDIESGNVRVVKGKRKLKDFEIILMHKHVQQNIIKLLTTEARYKQLYKSVKKEVDWVDILAKTHNNEIHYFELKVTIPRLAIRQALGQIIEYAYYYSHNRAHKLYIIATDKPKEEDKLYIDYIRTKFNINIWFMYYDMKNRTLSEPF